MTEKHDLASISSDQKWVTYRDTGVSKNVLRVVKCQFKLNLLIKISYISDFENVWCSYSHITGKNNRGLWSSLFHIKYAQF